MLRQILPEDGCAVAKCGVRGYDAGLSGAIRHEKISCGFVIVVPSWRFHWALTSGATHRSLSNPLEAKPDIPDKVLERTGELVEDAKDAIHEATRPVVDKLKK